MRSAMGFTLIELMVAVLVVAVLAAIGFPSYRDYVTRGKLAEAHATLAAQRVRMEQYYQDMRSYTGACTAGTVAPPPVGKHFNYACNIAGDGQGYTITATGIAAQGTDQFGFSVDEANNRSTTSVPTGWTANATCWIRNKGGEC